MERRMQTFVKDGVRALQSKPEGYKTKFRAFIASQLGYDGEWASLMHVIHSRCHELHVKNSSEEDFDEVGSRKKVLRSCSEAIFQQFHEESMELLLGVANKVHLQHDTEREYRTCKANRNVIEFSSVVFQSGQPVKNIYLLLEGELLLSCSQRNDSSKTTIPALEQHLVDWYDQQKGYD